MPRGIKTVIGFLLVLSGFISLILSMIGLELSFLRFLDAMNPLLRFIVRLVMIVGGLILMYIDSIREPDIDEK